MGMRKYYRSIAKARMAEMGIEHVNEKMGLHISRAKLREAFRCMGKKNRAELRQDLRTKAIWRRVLFGDLAKKLNKEKQRKERRAFLQKMNYYRDRENERRA